MEFDRKLFVSMFYDAYINKYINSNLNCHIEFYKTLKEMASMKKEADMLKKYDYMKSILSNNEFDGFDISVVDETHTSEDIYNIIHTNQQEHDIFEKVKDVLTENAYVLFNFIYTCLIRQERFSDVVMCVKYLLGMKKKELVRGAANVDVIDMMFNVMTYTSKMMSKDLHKYVSISQWLMYFRSNKKVLRERVRLLFVTLYVFINNTLDTSKILTKTNNVTCDYLFVLCEKDYKTKLEIENACQMLRLRKYDTKDVRLKKYHPSDVDMHIIKNY
jgi:hypothetical protein